MEGLPVIRPPSLRCYDFPLPRCDIVMKSDGNVYLAEIFDHHKVATESVYAGIEHPLAVRRNIETQASVPRRRTEVHCSKPGRFPTAQIEKL